MRIEGSVTALSWIPSEAISGLSRLPFDLGTFHYDDPPPADLAEWGDDPVEALRVADRFRVANVLSAWIEVDDDGAVTGAGHLGHGSIGATTLKVLRGATTVLACPLPDIQAEPVIEGGTATFRQTAGGRTGVPFPRVVKRAPFVQYRAPIAWSTLELALHADGRVEGRLVGASPFPRHWVYDTAGKLSHKSAVTADKKWQSVAFGKRTPWGDLDSPALVATVETELERELSTRIMRGGPPPEIRRLGEGDLLVAQGDQGDEMFLLLDGILEVDVDGEVVAEVGPGAVVGERAHLEGGLRTSTLRARTKCRVACTHPGQLQGTDFQELADGHRREQRPEPSR
jgi:hypothetical protein